MPYIPKTKRRNAVDEPSSPGELNYALTMVCAGYLEREGLCYAHINDCLGALSGAALELYRRVAVPYEDDKLDKNGDVYPLAITPG